MNPDLRIRSDLSHGLTGHRDRHRRDLSMKSPHQANVSKIMHFIDTSADLGCSHLYQIFSYVKNADSRNDCSVSGLLLYARTDALLQPDLDVVIQGNRIQAHTLDLAKPWEELRAQLESYLDSLEDPEMRSTDL